MGFSGCAPSRRKCLFTDWGSEEQVSFCSKCEQCWGSGAGGQLRRRPQAAAVVLPSSCVTPSYPSEPLHHLCRGGGPCLWWPLGRFMITRRLVRFLEQEGPSARSYTTRESCGHGGSLRDLPPRPRGATALPTLVADAGWALVGEMGSVECALTSGGTGWVCLWSTGTSRGQRQRRNPQGLLFVCCCPDSGLPSVSL